MKERWAVEEWCCLGFVLFFLVGIGCLLYTLVFKPTDEREVLLREALKGNPTAIKILEWEHQKEQNNGK